MTSPFRQVEVLFGKVGMEIQSVLSRFESRKVMVLGDVMLDEYIWTGTSRLADEAGTPILQHRDTTYALGGAANVAANITGLGGQGRLAGAVGHDPTGRLLTRLLRTHGVGARGLALDPERPTTVKTRVVHGGQVLLRIDREICGSLDEAASRRVLDYVVEGIDQADALIVSDYAKGVVSPETLSAALAAARSRARLVVVDPKGEDYTRYAGADVLMPNRREVGIATRCAVDDEASLVAAGRSLLSLAGCQAVVVKCGPEGMLLIEQNGSVKVSPASMPVAASDAIGAGDVAVAALTLGLVSGLNLAEAADLANHAAGLAVARPGTALVTREELGRLGRSAV